MKTATVRDLRNHFADVAKWIESGQQVTITRNGVAFATLAPAKPQSGLGNAFEAIQAGGTETD
jgi:prevent-host-death family protein